VPSKTAASPSKPAWAPRAYLITPLVVSLAGARHLPPSPHARNSLAIPRFVDAASGAPALRDPRSGVMRYALSAGP